MITTLIVVAAVLGVTGLGYLLIGGVSYLLSKTETSPEDAFPEHEHRSWP